MAERVATIVKENESCEVSEAKSGECFQEEGVAGCVLSCGESE